jgi:hypothetical protein
MGPPTAPSWGPQESFLDFKRSNWGARHELLAGAWKLLELLQHYSAVYPGGWAPTALQSAGAAVLKLLKDVTQEYAQLREWRGERQGHEQVRPAAAARITWPAQQPRPSPVAGAKRAVCAP